MAWQVEMVPEVKAWMRSLDPDTYDRVTAAVKALRIEGPQLGRPLVDTVKGSQLRNLKELRPTSPGRSKIRILFVFDPDRCAVLLVGGDKSGQWNAWYEASIREAEWRLEAYLARKKEGET